MPTYEYVCSKCKHQFEIVQAITEKPLRVCPEELCPRKPWAKGRVKRCIGAGAGLIFKGSGFYSTDYRSENYKAAAKKETESAKPPEPAKSGKPGAAATKSDSGSPSAPGPPSSAPSKE